MSTSKNPEAIRVPAPILTIVHIILVILLGNLLPLPVPVPAFVPWLGLVIAGLGLVLGILASMEFRRIRTTMDLKKSPTGLVTSGVYRYTRNPVYLGFVFMLIGFSLSMRTYWGIIFIVPLVTLMNTLVIKKEEANLEKKFKTQYADYKSRVRRWL
ncbi:MAG: isoprenylcysteine carboxylmethyltransferase family protein [Anaerolineales bacterium]|nr:isoprenylcysteine carboxylmethyltransferase family protein [Anaerolineales bacterium]